MTPPGSFQTIAEISIGLAGFSGLIMALRRRAGPLSGVQKFRLSILLALAFGAMLMSLIPDALLNLGVEAGPMWRYSCLLMSLYSTLFLLWWFAGTRRIARVAPEIFNWLAYAAMAVGHVFNLLLQLAVVFGMWVARSDGIFGIGLIWYVFHASQQFARMVFIQPRTADDSMD